MRIFQLLILLFFVSSSYSQKNLAKPNCITQDKSDSNDSIDNKITKVCIFKNYKFVSIGSPDYKGRYDYEYFVYKIEKEKDIPTKNSDIFLNIKEIEKLLNKKFKKKIAVAKRVDEDSECMKWVNFKKYKLDDIAITFNENNEMEFEVSIALPDACFSLSFIDVSLKLDIIEKYLK